MTARYPWPTYRHPWSLDVSSVRIDGATRDDVDLDTTRRLDLTSIDGWRELELDVRAQAGDGLDLQLHGVHVLVEAVATGLRRPYPLVAAQGGYVGTLRVHRADVAGAVHVHAVVSAVVDGRIRAAGSSDTWTLAVDRSAAPVPPGAPPFTTVWADFASDEAPILARRSPTAHAHFDASAEPVLYLNSGIEGFGSLLNADHAKTDRRRARDLMGSQIARLALAAMFRAAAEDVLRSVDLGDEGPPAPPDSTLNRRTAEAVASAMPAISSPADLYERLVAAHRGSAADRASLWAEIDLAVDALTGVSDTVSSVSKELRHA